MCVCVSLSVCVCVCVCVCMSVTLRVVYLSSVMLLVVVRFSVAQRAVAVLALRSSAGGAVVLWVFFTGRFIRHVLHPARNHSLRQTLTKHRSVTAPCVCYSACVLVCQRAHVLLHVSVCMCACVHVRAYVRACVCVY